MTKKKPVTHIAFALDESGSMSRFSRKAVDVANAIIGTIREKAARNDQHEITVSLYKFASRTYSVFTNADVRTLKDMDYRDYDPNGYTALYGTINRIESDFKQLKDANDENTSFLVMILTDGEETISPGGHSEPARRIRETQMTGRWSWVFQLPPGYSERFCKTCGIPSDNAREWEFSEKGLNEVQQSTSAGITSYLTGRESGVRSVTKFYADVDLAKVTDKQIKANLVDISVNFKVFEVDKVDRADEFVERKTRKPLVLGSLFYQLSKKELVQASKPILIMKNGSTAIYGGAAARQLIGLPDGDVKVTPKNFKDYAIFVRSTAPNRKLYPGTKVLWDKTLKDGCSPTWDYTAVSKDA